MTFQVRCNVGEVKTLQTKIRNAVRKDENDHSRLGDLNENNKKLAIRIRTALKEEQDKIEKKLSPKKTFSPTRNKPLTSREETDLRMRQTQIASQSKLFFTIYGASTK